jgi:hypothetical protein
MSETITAYKGFDKNMPGQAFAEAADAKEAV